MDAHPGRWIRTAVAGLMLAGAVLVHAQDQIDDPTSPATLIAPTQGRPVFVRPRGTFKVQAQMPGETTGVKFELVRLGRSPERHELRVVGDPAHGAYQLALPDGVPERTYDLIITAGGQRLIGRHAVAVREVGEHVRLVHLSDMNIGDIGAPDFDKRLVAEVNLLRPTLIIVTGDLLDATYTDPETGWEIASNFLARFDAPTLVACGDHDDITQYSRHMAPSPIGMVRVGNYQGLVLYDLPNHPILDDAQQINWVENQLTDKRKMLSFVVAHDERPNLLWHWRDQGKLGEILKSGALGLWIAGGHRDWDGREYGEIVTAAAPMVYLRTHQASPATVDGAAGVSHYQVIDLDGRKVTVRGTRFDTGPSPSFPVGRFNIVFDGPNDGSQSRISLDASSSLPFRMDGLGVPVRVRREGDQQPWCLGGRIEQAVPLGDMWECMVGFDLPDKGAARLVVGTGQKPVEPNLDVQFIVPDTLEVRTVKTADDVTCHAAVDWAGLIQIQNAGPARVAFTPIVRLDGETVGYSLVEEPGPVANAYRLRLKPQQLLTLHLDLSACRISPGRRELQVYLDTGGSRIAKTKIVIVRMKR